LKQADSADDNEALRALFVKASGDEKLTVRLEALKDAGVPALLSVSEQSRRMEDLMRMYRMAGEEADFRMPTENTLILNSTSPLIARMSALLAEQAEKAESLAAYLYRLALLAQRKLTATEMQDFLKDSYRILDELAR
jgi:molecular chaperone HtpG